MLKQLHHIASQLIQVGKKLFRLLFPKMHLRALIRLNRQAFVRWRLRSMIAARVRDHDKSVTGLYASVVRIRQKPLTPAERTTKATRHLNLTRIISQNTGRDASLAELNSFELSAVYEGVVYAMANVCVYGTPEPGIAAVPA